MRVIIAGGRDFRDFDLMIEKCDKFFSKVKTPIVIISGKQRSYDRIKKEFYGADFLGEEYAKLRGYQVDPFPADWDTHGKAAGMIRNRQMLVEGKAQGLIAFWDGESRGTRNMIDLAIKARLPVRIVEY